MCGSLVHVEVSSSIFRKPPVDATSNFQLEDISGPGCRLSGSLQLDKVSGKLKIYVAEKGKDGSLNAPKEDVNLSHNVRYLTFTDSLEATEETKVRISALLVHLYCIAIRSFGNARTMHRTDLCLRFS